MTLGNAAAAGVRLMWVKGMRHPVEKSRQVDSALTRFLFCLRLARALERTERVRSFL
jgi:hypothetical protein